MSKSTCNITQYTQYPVLVQHSKLLSNSLGKTKSVAVSFLSTSVAVNGINGDCFALLNNSENTYISHSLKAVTHTRTHAHTRKWVNLSVNVQNETPTASHRLVWGEIHKLSTKMMQRRQSRNALNKTSLQATLPCGTKHWYSRSISTSCVFTI